MFSVTEKALIEAVQTRLREPNDDKGAEMPKDEKVNPTTDTAATTYNEPPQNLAAGPWRAFPENKPTLGGPKLVAVSHATASSGFKFWTLRMARYDNIGEGCPRWWCVVTDMPLSVSHYADLRDPIVSDAPTSDPDLPAIPRLECPLEEASVEPALEPNLHWSFKRTPCETDLRRILRESEEAGARAIGIRLCGQAIVGLRKKALEAAAGLSLMNSLGVMGQRGLLSCGSLEWMLMWVSGDPAEAAKAALAELDAWAGKRHRTTVAVFK